MARSSYRVMKHQGRRGIADESNRVSIDHAGNPRQETFSLIAPSFDAKAAFQREVAGRFGLVPNFFSSAPDAPEIIERLWDFAKAAYLDNPIPSLFKERLFVYLSRRRDLVSGRIGNLRSAARR